MEVSYAHEEWKSEDGRLTLHAGDVVRMNDWGAFADNVILGFTAENGKEAHAKVSRPYLYASLVGTTCASSMLGHETYDLPVKHIIENFKVMVNDGRYKT